MQQLSTCIGVMQGRRSLWLSYISYASELWHEVEAAALDTWKSTKESCNNATIKLIPLLDPIWTFGQVQLVLPMIHFETHILIPLVFHWCSTIRNYCVREEQLTASGWRRRSCQSTNNFKVTIFTSHVSLWRPYLWSCQLSWRTIAIDCGCATHKTNLVLKSS